MTSQLQTRSFTSSFQRLPYVEFLLLMVAIFWGTSYAMTKQGLSYTNVFMFIALRFSITFICLLPCLIRDIYQQCYRSWLKVVPTGIILATIFFCEVYGVAHTSASKAAFIVSLSVVLTAMLEPIINGHRLSKGRIGLAMLSVVGIALLTGWQPNQSADLNLGDGFILAAAFLRALMVTVTKRFTQHQSLSSLSITAVQSGTVSILALGCCWATQSRLSIPSDHQFWIIMVYLVLCCTLFAFFVQNFALQKTSPTKVSLLMGSEPLFGAIFAMMWLHESLSFSQLIGGGLIVISVLVTSKGRS